tara:strand:- start:98 stop:628 length:531 start_codon:yes stop_codon:yes gene_type:complete
VGFEVEIEEQILEGGVLNSFYESIATLSTDASGFYYLEFPRKNAISYRITVNHDGWFPLSEEISPDLFTPSSPVDVNLVTTPKADLEIRVINSLPALDTDIMRVRLLKSFKNYSTCDTEWKIYHGTNIDSTIACIMPGDVWMPYLSIDQSDEEFEVTVIDSVFCSAFETTTINVVY